MDDKEINVPSKINEYYVCSKKKDKYKK